MKKRIFAMILCLCLVISCFPLYAFAAEEGVQDEQAVQTEDVSAEPENLTIPGLGRNLALHAKVYGEIVNKAEPGTSLEGLFDGDEGTGNWAYNAYNAKFAFKISEKQEVKSVYMFHGGSVAGGQYPADASVFEMRVLDTAKCTEEQFVSMSEGDRNAVINDNSKWIAVTDCLFNEAPLTALTVRIPNGEKRSIFRIEVEAASRFDKISAYEIELYSKVKAPTSIKIVEPAQSPVCLKTGGGMSLHVKAEPFGAVTDVDYTYDGNYVAQELDQDNFFRAKRSGNTEVVLSSRGNPNVKTSIKVNIMDWEMPDKYKFLTHDDLFTCKTVYWDPAPSAKIYFGKTIEGKEASWWIAGTQDGKTLNLFAADPLDKKPFIPNPGRYDIDYRTHSTQIAGEQRVRPYWNNKEYGNYDTSNQFGVSDDAVGLVFLNHYGMSYVFEDLRDYTRNRNMFNQAEYDMMLPTTVFTADTRNSIPGIAHSRTNDGIYKTRELLYLPYAYPDPDVMGSDQSLKIGTVGGIVPVFNKECATQSDLSGGLQIDPYYWAPDILTRAPIDQHYNNVTYSMYVLKASDQHIEWAKVDEVLNICPATRINPKDILFASRADPDTTKEGSVPLKDAHTLRFSGRNLGSATISIDGSMVTLKNVPSNVRLYAQNSEGAWAVTVGNKKFVRAKDMGKGFTSFLNCRVWIEQYEPSNNRYYAYYAFDPDESDQWIYRDDGWHFWTRNGEPKGVTYLEGWGEFYIFDENGALQAGDENGDQMFNGNLYYINPDRDVNDPYSCYFVRDYARVRPGVGITYYNHEGITYVGWVNSKDADGYPIKRYQTMVNVDGKNIYIYVWRAQYIPEWTNPVTGEVTPAGWYLFDDNGILIDEDGFYECGDGFFYRVKDGVIVEQAAEHVHHGTFVEQTWPDCVNPGYQEHYVCDCGRIFADEACTQELTMGDIIILPLYGAHVYLMHYEAREPTEDLPGNIEYWMCVECNTCFLDAEATIEIPYEDVFLYAGWHREDDGWHYYKDKKSVTGVQYIESIGEFFIFDENGALLTGDENGDQMYNGNLYYINPENDPQAPETGYFVRNYSRVRPGVGITYYNNEGITYVGWVTSTDAAGNSIKLYQTMVYVDGKPLYIYVWRAQHIPEWTNPVTGEVTPAGFYLFGDDGVLITEDGIYECGDGNTYTVSGGVIVG